MYQFPRISPDGTKVALSIAGENAVDIWIRDLVRKTLTRLTFDGSEMVPVWSQDGKRVAFYSWHDNKQANLLEGSRRHRRGRTALLGKETMVAPYCWSKDGNTLLMGNLLATA